MKSVIVLISAAFLAGIMSVQAARAQTGDHVSFKGGSLRFSVVENSNDRRDSFNHDAQSLRVHTEILSCDLLIDISVGIKDGNNSYGGFCKARQGAAEIEVEICNDDLVGHFHINNIDRRKLTKVDLAAFVAENCYGG